jgi:hypothetical protein
VLFSCKVPLLCDLPSYITLCVYEGVSKSYRIKLITKYTHTTINTGWEATQRVIAAKLTILTHRIAIQLHLVAESCTICSSRSRRPVRKLFDLPSYIAWCLQNEQDRQLSVEVSSVFLSTVMKKVSAWVNIKLWVWRRNIFNYSSHFIVLLVSIPRKVVSRFTILSIPNA